MIFKQFFDPASCTYSYLLASRKGREALIIDPVSEHVSLYLDALTALKVKLVFAIDTHTHADHITGTGLLQKHTSCKILMGEQTKAEFVTIKVKDNDKIQLDGTPIQCLYTPGHTDDSYSFVVNHKVFTGDTLLIGSTGRTDFQNGNPYQSYESIFYKLLALPDETQIYPAHDYNHCKFSTIGREKKNNPRLQVKSIDEYVHMMNHLNLPKPKLMDIALPANQRCGLIESKK